ncbi:BnaA05g13040D [Brassica napus]|uniref:BnaA05g13040D protein n=1 Tax=Brassica napus TaxID=3708 RepID=A0A078HJF2_BRANA|nr:BnaA05g13040D [Brassica napus]
MALASLIFKAVVPGLGGAKLNFKNLGVVQQQICLQLSLLNSVTPNNCKFRKRNWDQLVACRIRDELIIAREIVINDAEASLRHKLTLRSTQEEIQRCTGAVVITRGKYRFLNAPLDGEKPLYLHISAASHLKETTERILAVDRAAAMIEEMMRQKPSSQLGVVGFHTVKVRIVSSC